MKYLKDCKDYEYLKSTLSLGTLEHIDRVLESYGNNELSLLKETDEYGGFDFSSIELNTSNYHKALHGDELLILKWYEDYEDVGYLASTYLEGYLE